LQKTVRRHKFGFAAAGAIAAVVVAGLVVSTIALARERIARERAVKSEQQQTRLREQAERAAELEVQLRSRAEKEELAARQNLYAADINPAHEASLAGNLGRAQDLLDLHRPKEGQSDLRGFEWRYLWNETRGDNVVTFRGHGNVITSVAISPDGKTVLSGSQDGTVRMWDLASGQDVGVVGWFSGHVYSVAFSRDGEFFSVGSYEGASLWHTATREKIADLGGQNARATFSPTHDLIAYGTSANYWFDQGQSASLLNYASGELLEIFPGGGSLAAFSPDGRLLALAGTNDAIRLWNIESRQEIGTLPMPGAVTGLAFNRDGRDLVVSYNSDERVYVWDVETQRIRTSFDAHSKRASLAFSPDGQTLATAGLDYKTRLWDATTWQPKTVLRGHGNDIWTVVFTPDGEGVVTGSKDETVMVSPVNPERQTNVIHGIRRPVRVSPDGSLLVALDARGQLGIWDLPTRQRTDTLPTQDSPVGFMPDGKRLVTLGDSAELKIWDIGRKAVQVTTTLSGADTIAWAVLAPDGSTLATVSRENRVQLWNTRTGERRGDIEVDLKTPNHEAVVFSPDSRKLASVKWATAPVLWDVATLKPLRTFQKHRMFVGDCDWSQDGRLLATGSWDNRAIVWDAVTGKDLLTLPLPGGGSRVCFSRDGRTLATSSHTHLKLWNLATGRGVATLSAIPDPQVLFFSPGDRDLLVWSSEGSLHLLHAPLLAEIEAADPSRPSSEHDATLKLNNQAWSLATSPEAMQRNGTAAVALAQQAVSETGRTNAMYLGTLAAAYAEAGQFSNAVRVQREAIALIPAKQTGRREDFESRLRLFESNRPYRDARELATRASNLLAQRKFTESEQAHREALEMRRKVFGDEHPDVALSLHHLAIGLHHQGKLEEAERLCRESLEMRRRLAGFTRSVETESFQSLLSILRDERKQDEVDALYREELALRRKALGDDHPAVAAAFQQLA